MMTSSRNIYRVSAALIVLVGLLASCAQPPTGVEETRPGEPSTVGDARGFDPLELPQDREIIPAKYPRAGNISGQQALVAAEAGSGEEDTALMALENFTREVDTVNSQAFRVQIYTSKLYGEARASARVAEEIFDQQVYVDYQVPNFKVRVGDFASRDNAESYAQRAKAAGFTSAWVVMVNIEVREASPLYDDLTDFLLEAPPVPLDSLETPGTDE
ncbi:MAG: SPOR domain-containing protein [bacterium]|nr:SPOR domain-containing protein [bacterium]